MNSTETAILDARIADLESAKNAEAKECQRLSGSDTSPADFSELTTKLPALYVIQQVGGDVVKTFKDMTDFKAAKKRACSKLNMSSQVIYVGSSFEGLTKRMKLHLHENDSKKTFALHMNYWFEGQYQVHIEFYDVTKGVLQILEDTRSQAIKPAFGKLGGNNQA